MQVPVLTAEQQAREQINTMLGAEGWLAQTRHERAATWSEENQEGRWRSFP